MPKLLIGSKLKRPKAPVALPNEGKPDTIYYFRPRDPEDPRSEHVAVVENARHQQRLLQIDECYYIAEDEAPAEPVKRPEAPQVEAKQPDAPASAATPDTAVNATAVLALPLKEFKTAIKLSDLATLSAALTAEKAKGEDERPTYVKAIEDQIAALTKAKAA